MRKIIAIMFYYVYMDDRKYMTQAIHMARKGTINVLPNPMVGAVIVHNDTIIAKGYHQSYGDVHAEVDALQSLDTHTKEQFHHIAHDCTLYCTLEPCSHQWKGKTHPSCCDAIISSGIKRVCIASLDPNPKVHGKGIKRLRNAGVMVDIMDTFSPIQETMNEVFYVLQKQHKPFIHVKIAQSLDARMAAPDGSSQWITDMASRSIAHSMRATHQAILTGVDTISHDNPLYTVRHTKGINPAVVIVDTRLRIDMDAVVLAPAQRRAPGIMICTSTASYKRKKRAQLEERGIRVLVLPTEQDIRKRQRLDISALFKALMDEGIYSVLVESGATLIQSCMNSGMVDKLSCFIAPKLLGGDYHSIVHLPIRTIDQAYPLHRVQTKMIPNSADVLISGYLYDVFGDNKAR